MTRAAKRNHRVVGEDVESLPLKTRRIISPWRRIDAYARVFDTKERRGRRSSSVFLLLMILLFSCFLLPSPIPRDLPKLKIFEPSPLSPPTIYFVVTTSLLTTTGETDQAKRQEQYKRGISKLQQARTKYDLSFPSKVIVAENNGRRKTFLDDLNDISVLYTDTNLPTSNMTNESKGTKEMLDILACIDHFEMRPYDLVVKLTGRYHLAVESDKNNDGQKGQSFMQVLRNLDSNTRTQAIVKFGSYSWPSNYRKADCITGLIMMPVYAIQQIKYPADIIEHEWAKVALAMPSEFVHAVQGKIGIYIAPGGVDYYLV